MLAYAIMPNHFRIFVYVSEPEKIGDEEILRRINALYREASLAQVLGERTRLKNEEAKLLGRARLTEKSVSRFGEYRRSILRRMWNSSEFMRTCKRHFTMSFNARRDHHGAMFEGLYHGRNHKPEMELASGYCDFCLFPERVYYGDAQHSYIVELRQSKADADEADLAAKAADGIAKLHRYASDPFVPELAKDTALHLILFRFKDTELVRLEEIAQGQSRDVSSAVGSWKAGHCLLITENASGCVVDGFCFEKGAPTNSGNKYGGGIDCLANATIRHCTFRDDGNSSTTFAGGLHTSNGAQVLIENCLFVNNCAWACGGATLTEGNRTAIFDRCTVHGNRSDDFIGNEDGDDCAWINGIVWAAVAQAPIIVDDSNAKIVIPSGADPETLDIRIMSHGYDILWRRLNLCLL